MSLAYVIVRKRKIQSKVLIEYICNMSQLVSLSVHVTEGMTTIPTRLLIYYLLREYLCICIPLLYLSCVLLYYTAPTNIVLMLRVCIIY